MGQLYTRVRRSHHAKRRETLFFQARFKGEIIRVTIGRYTGVSASAEAGRKHAKEINADLANGIDPRPEKKAAEAATFGDMLQGYVKLLEQKGKKSAHAVKNQITADIEKLSGNCGTSGLLGLSGLGLSDHNGFYGAVRFAEAAAAHQMPTVFGAEVTLGTSLGRSDVPDPAGTHLLVLARQKAGYHRLSAALTRRTWRPRTRAR